MIAFTQATENRNEEPSHPDVRRTKNNYDPPIGELNRSNQYSTVLVKIIILHNMIPSPEQYKIDRLISS